MKEEFVNIEGFNDYQISNLGRVKSTKSRQEIFLRQMTKRGGYKYVNLSNKDKRIAKYIHQLVATAFIPNPNNYYLVNHKDENPSNNCVDNLEWRDHKYNLNYGHAKEKRSKRVVQLTLDDTIVNEFPSIREAERQTGISVSSIVGCCIGRVGYKTAGGFKWKYAA